MLAAVQWLPAAVRFAGSPRAGGLVSGRATVWSAPPARLVELVFPRFFGDPMRDFEGLFFGWNLHDRDFPYVASLYPGLLLTVLAIAPWRAGRSRGAVPGGSAFAAAPSWRSAGTIRSTSRCARRYRCSPSSAFRRSSPSWPWPL